MSATPNCCSALRRPARAWSPGRLGLFCMLLSGVSCTPAFEVHPPEVVSSKPHTYRFLVTTEEKLPPSRVALVLNGANLPMTQENPTSWSLDVADPEAERAHVQVYLEWEMFWGFRSIEYGLCNWNRDADSGKRKKGMLGFRRRQTIRSAGAMLLH